jgi:DNA ligase-1
MKIYSRNLEDNSGKFPDVKEDLPKAKKDSITSFIIDCEVVAWDTEKQKILPFQILSTRARKVECLPFGINSQSVQLNEIKVQVCLYAFDMLYCNGEVV